MPAIRRPAPRAPLPDPCVRCTLGFIFRAVTPSHLVVKPTRRVRHQFWGCQVRSTVMDYSKIPYFALLRQSGTVIVRADMDTSNRWQLDTSPIQGYPWILHRISACIKCICNRSNNKYSESVNGLVGRSRIHRQNLRKNRHVNAWAVVCLFILVGSIVPPFSAAAPQHHRTMDRQRRSSSQENSLWGNPCDYDSNPASPNYSAKLAKDVASQARNAYESTAKYKDKFALKLHSYQTFDELLPVWASIDWLRNFTWFPEEGLPKDKVLYKTMPDAYMIALMAKVDDVLPAMYKGLKMIVAGLYSISKDGFSNDIFSDASLKHNITESMHNVRAVLCMFDELIKARKLEVKPLPDSEVPDIKSGDKPSYALLVYRDTLNYLEYIDQVFQKMYDVDSKN